MSTENIIGIVVISLILNGCVNTGKMNFENNIDNRVNIGKPTIQKLVEVGKKRNNYMGTTRLNNNMSIQRYHFKLKGNPRLEPCYYYYDVNYKTKRLLGWGYDDKGDERACVN